MWGAGMDKEYRQKVRSLSFNLSDASNPELRARVLQGEVSPDQLVQMTPNELASKVPIPRTAARIPRIAARTPGIAARIRRTAATVLGLLEWPTAGPRFMSLDGG